MKKLLVVMFTFGFLFVGFQAHAEDNFVPSITVTSPNSGFEAIESGQKIEIRWDSNVAINAMVDVYVSDGVHKGAVVRGSNNGAAGLIYTLDSSLVPGSNYRAYVSLVSETPVIDSSDNPFTIKPIAIVSNENTFVPSITVTSPNNGGESVEVGKKLEIRWDSNVAINALVDVYVSDGVNKGTVVRTSNNGTLGLIYTLSNNLIPGSNYKAYVSLVSETPVIDSSDKPFTIKSSSTIDTSCSGGAIYSSVTGKKCSEKDEIKDTGCIAGYNYSSTTGKPCALGLYKKDNTDVLNPTDNTVPITSSLKRTLKIGVKGDDVKALQAFLNLLADGSFGPKTQAKVMEWQAAHGLTADGSFGRMSREKAGLTQ